MIKCLNQKEAIGVLKNIKILPTNYESKITICGNKKMVYRVYHINEYHSEYPAMDKIAIEYKIGRFTEDIADYAIYLTNDNGDILYLCKYTTQILNTLFNNIILLELSNWRRVVKNQEPLKTINDYKSLMFELNTGLHKKNNSILKNILEDDFSNFSINFQKYFNSDELIPTVLWEQYIV